MDKTASGGDITLNIIHAYNDTALTLTDLQYTVYDATGAALLGPTSAPSFDPSKDETSVVIEGVHNTTLAKYDIRSVEFKLITDSATYTITEFYEIEGDVLKLTPYVDSFMSFAESKLVERRLSAPTPYYDSLTDAEKAVALENAFNRLIGLRFTDYGYLSDLTQSQIATLDYKLLEALKRSQIMEANHLVEVNPVRDKIRQGIISETIGESSMFFKQTNSEERTAYPGISDDTYPLLSKYLYRATSNSQIWKLRRS